MFHSPELKCVCGMEGVRGTAERNRPAFPFGTCRNEITSVAFLWHFCVISVSFLWLYCGWSSRKCLPNLLPHSVNHFSNAARLSSTVVPSLAERNQELDFSSSGGVVSPARNSNMFLSCSSRLIGSDSMKGMGRPMTSTWSVSSSTTTLPFSSPYHST